MDTQSNDQINIPKTPEGQAVIHHLTIMYGVGPDAEANYQRSLDSIRKNMDASVQILVNAYNEVDKMFYADRAALIQALADLNGMPALSALERVAREPLPSRDSLIDHQISPFNEESVIKITAIRGIGKLAVRNDTAVNVLVTFFDYPDPVIRLDALNTLADAIRQVDENRKKRLLALLPKDYVFVSDVSGIRPGPIEGENSNLKPSGKGKGSSPKGN